MPKHHKKAGRGLLFIVVLLIAGVIWTQVRPIANAVPTVTSPDRTVAAKPVDLPWPEYGQAAFGSTGTGVIATHGDQKPVPTASLAKVITALAVLRQYPLRGDESGPVITITQADIDSYNRYVAQDGSVVRVSLGERITERQALQALLLPSANNMADTLARWAFGSVDKYLTYANSFAKDLGLQSVKVTDPSGLAATTVASARDMTVIGQLAMLDPVFTDIVNQSSATIPVQGAVRNYNSLLGSDGNIGIKTGNNDENKGAFLFANTFTVSGKKLTLVGAVMGGPDLTTTLRDSNRLAAATAKQFTPVTFVKAGQPVAAYRTDDGRTVQAVVDKDLSGLIWNGTALKLKTIAHPLAVGVPAGTQIGTISYTSADSTSISESVALQTDTAAPAPGRLWRLTHPW